MDGIPDLSVLMQQIEHIAEHANRWLNFSLVCGIIGFCLSVACAVYLIVRWKRGED